MGKIILVQEYHGSKLISDFKTLVRTKREYALHLSPITKALMSAIEAAEGLFYRYVFGNYAECRKGRMRVLCRATGPEARKKHLAEQFPWNLQRKVDEGES